MLNVFICEDEERPREQIAKVVQDYICMEDMESVMQLTLAAESPHDILDYVKQNQVAGLYFLDFDLHCDMNGVELAVKIRKLDPRAFIVFITSHAEALLITFEYQVEALDFLAKDNIGIANRIRSCLKNALEKYTAKTTLLQKNFSFTAAGHVVVVNCSEILYFEAVKGASHRVMLYTKTASYDFLGSLHEIEKQLDKDFLRCHRSCIVNTKNIASIDRTQKIIYFKNKIACSISPGHIKRIARAANL